MNKPLPRRQIDTAKLHNNYGTGDLHDAEIVEAAFAVIGATATSKTCERFAMYLRGSISFVELVIGELS